MKDVSDIIISKNHSLARHWKKAPDTNIFAVGSSGSGKTFNIVVPNILQTYGDYIVIDVGGYLYKQHAQFLKDNEYQVSKLDFSHMDESFHYNPFCYIKDKKNDPWFLATTLIENTNPASGQADDFWQDSDRLLLTSLICYIDTFADETNKNFSEITRLLRLMHSGDKDAVTGLTVDEMFDKACESDPLSPAVINYRSFKARITNREYKDAVVSLLVRLSPLDLAEIKGVTETDDGVVDNIGKGKKAVFICPSFCGGAYNFLVQALLTQILQMLSYKFEEGEPIAPVTLLLDEMANIGKIHQLPAKMAYLTRAGVSFIFLTQSIRQIKDMYGKKYKEIIDMCDTWMLLGGGTDIDTAEWASKYFTVRYNLLMQSIEQLKDKYSKKHKEIEDMFDTQELTGKSTDIDAVELAKALCHNHLIPRNLPHGKCLVRISGCDKAENFEDDIYPTREHPNWSEVADN